jgi:pyruvate dehydrogenase E2 component (dihydrolipoamide acetyltransferase)
MSRPDLHPSSPRARKTADRLGIAVKTLTGSGPNGRVVEADVLNAPSGPKVRSRITSSPLARKIAAKLGIPLETLTGSGPNGRIVKADVLHAAATAPKSKGTRRPFTGMRRTIATRLTESKQSIPHFYMKKTVRMPALLTFLAERKTAHPCTLNDLFLKATAIAIRDLPAFRTRIEGEEIVEIEEVNLGIAVGIEGGVVVPVLLNADTLPLAELAVESKRLVALARERRIENSGCGVFTLSNLGMFGVEEFSAIINPPESGILAIGAARDDAAAGEKLLTLTLSCDHRVVDGMAAAQFLNQLAAILETPTMLLDR